MQNWQPNGEWAGATVVVLGAGPSAQDDLDAMPLGNFRVIAANRAASIYPDADMMVAIDGNPPPTGFGGAYVCGVPDVESDDALYVGVTYEVAPMEEGNVEIRNNTLLAIRIAVGMGAAEIILAGIDAERYAQLHDFPYFGPALNKVMAEVEASGIPIRFA